MEINLKDFLSVSDSIHLDTEAFQSAINQLNQSGGGKLIVPAGKYYIGTIKLKSNITLELLSGAEIYGSKNLGDYYVNGYVHNELGNWVWPWPWHFQPFDEYGGFEGTAKTIFDSH